MKKTPSDTLTIKVPHRNNTLIQQAMDEINANEEVKTLWKIINVIAIDRLGMSDHGPVHFQIVANIGLRLTRILLKNDIKLSITKDFDLSPQHGELVVFLASLLHDIGMSIDRPNHEQHSLFLADSILRQILHFIPTQERLIVISETLHAIISHRRGGKPITIEGGIVRVADALDMSQGRSRIPYEQGKVHIYSVSAIAIESVEIKEGKEKPIQITIQMNNSSGIFQVDELLKQKISQSGIEQYMEVKATVQGDCEKKLMDEFYLREIK